MGGLGKSVRWSLHMGSEGKGGAEAAPSFQVWMKWGLFPNRGAWEASKGRCAQGCGGAGQAGADISGGAERAQEERGAGVGRPRQGS